jgi:phosphate transport system substrate-binding protein
VPDGVTLQGCGATFPAPLYQRWFLEFYKANPDVRTNYQAIGSGAGVNQFQQGLVHFGATDDPLKSEKIKEIGESLSKMEGSPVTVMQVPLTAGSVAFCFNIPGIDSLRLSRKTYLGIVTEQITLWDDDQIRADNPGLHPPHLPIRFIRRAESSGTTAVFSAHLIAAAKAEKFAMPEWLSKAAKSLQWPKDFVGGKGNAGVAALLQQTPGAIGYLEAGYAELAKLPTATLQNKAGKWVKASASSGEKTLALVKKFDSAFAASVADPDGEESYPLVTFTYAICRTQYADRKVEESLKKLFRWCATEGQKLSVEVGYIPFPESISKKVLAEIEKIGRD